METLALRSCPACGSQNHQPAFKQETSRHNSLLRVDASALTVAGKAIQRKFASPAWQICSDCDLIFAGNCPSDAGTADWYLDLFKLSEERGYDTYPLPENYVVNKKQSGADLYTLLNDNHLIPKGGSVLHVRCATAEFLRLARQELGCTIAGVDFFGSCVKHANTVLGEMAVKQMLGPQPENPFVGRKYDLIVSNHMITHAHDPATLVAHYREWLADTGVLVVLNEPDHALTLRSWKAYPRGINFFHKQLFTEATFKSSMLAWGFAVERITPTIKRDRKFEKNMLCTCRKTAAKNLVQSEINVSHRALRAWELRRRIIALVGFNRKT